MTAEVAITKALIPATSEGAAPSAKLVAEALDAICPLDSPAAFPATIHGERGAGIIQPVPNVRAYLKDRKPVAHFDDEQHLFITLPGDIRSYLTLLLGTDPGGGAFGSVQSRVNAGSKVFPSCKTVLRLFPKVGLSLKRFHALYCSWAATRDWVTLVNRAKAGSQWQVIKEALPDLFIDLCSSRIGKCKRTDARRQALFAIIRIWKTGRDKDGKPLPIAGYGNREVQLNGRMVTGGFWQDWYRKTYPGKPLPEEAPLPPGWSYDNISRQITFRNALPDPVKAMLVQGTAAAREFLPGAHRTRALLRFMEEVQFDDVKTDFRIVDPGTGQVCDLWLLVARDLATTVLLGFGMRPAVVREDGTQVHLKLKDCKQLCGWLLERFGLPPYLMVWKFERGTATLSKGSRGALRELLPGRIDVRFSGMVGGKSPAGYDERRVGNSKGKASLESLNRLGHTMCSDLPGQTGPHYGKRPSDLGAREKECREIWRLAQFLPPELRGQIEYPLLTINQARAELFRIFGLQNHRCEHEIEGFAEVLEWWDPAVGKWKHQSTAPAPLPEGSNTRIRKESPVERAERLVTAAVRAGGKWTPVSPSIIAAFYEHTQRLVRIVNSAGEIPFRSEGRDLLFVAPAGFNLSQVAHHTSLLGYFHVDDPVYLHVTNGQGVFVGTWIRSDRAHDQHTLSEAIRYDRSAEKAAREMADHYTADDRQALDAMRARNAERLESHSFIEVAGSQISARGSEVGSPIATGLKAVATERARSKQVERDNKAEAEDAAKNLIRAMT